MSSVTSLLQLPSEYKLQRGFLVRFRLVRLLHTARPSMAITLHWFSSSEARAVHDDSGVMSDKWTHYSCTRYVRAVQCARGRRFVTPLEEEQQEGIESWAGRQVHKRAVILAVDEVKACERCEMGKRPVVGHLVTGAEDQETKRRAGS